MFVRQHVANTVIRKEQQLVLFSYSHSCLSCWLCFFVIQTVVWFRVTLLKTICVPNWMDKICDTFVLYDVITTYLMKFERQHNMAVTYPICSFKRFRHMKGYRSTIYMNHCEGNCDRRLFHQYVINSFNFIRVVYTAIQHQIWRFKSVSVCSF